MTRRNKVFIGVGVAVLGAGLVYGNFATKRNDGVTVTTEAVAKRDLEAIVSASGKIQAKREVNITSEVSGKVMHLAVDEGDRVKTGQFLLEVDPRNYRTGVQVSEAALEQSRISLQQARNALEQARVNLKLAQDDFQRKSDLSKAKLITRQEMELAENTVTLRQADVRTAEQAISNASQRIKSQEADLDSRRHDLSKVTITAPIDGLVTRRNVEEGETAMAGFTNNPSVVLLVISDMSVIQAEVEVDETDIPNVKLGQTAQVSIDALPERKFKGHVTEVGNSPITASASGGARAATNFKVVVTLDEEVPSVRPGFSATADITTATRGDAVSVPIQAMAVREVNVDGSGKVVREPKSSGKGRRAGGSAVETKVAAADKAAAEKAGADPKAGSDPKGGGTTKKELEGVFVVRNNVAEFTPVKTGIAGDKYFEVLDGLKVGDMVITGPFDSVRNLADGKAVKVEQPQPKAK
jgi:HlyD family secretion protein